MRGNAVFLTLRDPIAAVSVRVICSRQVFDAAEPPPADGARVVIFARPDFNANRGSFALTALEIRAVGVGELLARLERLRRQLASEGLFSSEQKRAIPFLPGVIGLICGRDSAAQRDVEQTPGGAGPPSGSASSRRRYRDRTRSRRSSTRCAASTRTATWT